MEGQIGVESKPGAVQTSGLQLSEKQLGAPKSPQQYSQDFAGARVLVVDDNATNRKILRHQILARKMQPGLGILWFLEAIYGWDKDSK
jgi:hypothetical protein